MTGPVQSSQPLASAALFSPAYLVIGIASGLVLAGTISLWVHYGERVYFDTIMTGLASCFSF